MLSSGLFRESFQRVVGDCRELLEREPMCEALRDGMSESIWKRFPFFCRSRNKSHSFAHARKHFCLGRVASAGVEHRQMIRLGGI